MSFCLNWGHFPGSILSAQGNTLQSMEDLSSTTGSCLNTIHIMVTGPPWRVINWNLYHWLSWIFQARTIQLIGHPAIKARQFLPLLKEITEQYSWEFAMNMFHRWCQRTSYHFPLKPVPSSQFLQQLYLPKASTVARTPNISLSWQSSINNHIPFPFFSGTRGPKVLKSQIWIWNYYGRIALPIALLYNMRWVVLITISHPSWAFHVLLRC